VKIAENCVKLRLCYNGLYFYVTSIAVIRLHRMHEMQSILTDVSVVCLPVCLSRGSSRLRCAKPAEQIKMLFGVNTPGGP